MSTKTKQKKVQKKQDFQVEAILDKKRQHGVWKYLVKWQNYSEDQSTWEPLEHLMNVRDLVDEFDESRKVKEPLREIKSSSKDNVRPNKEEEKKQSVPEVEECKTILRQKRKSSNVSLETISTQKSISLCGENDKENNGLLEESKEGLKISKEIIELHESISNDNKYLIGRFGTDKPIRVATVKQEKTQIICQLEWAMRSDGHKPEPTNYTNLELRRHCPDLLLDFYEARLKFPSNNN